MNNNFFLRVKERIRMESKHIGLLLLDLAVVIMCIVVIGSAGHAVTEFLWVFAQGYDADSLYYRTYDGSYAVLADMTWINRTCGRGDDADSQEYYAVADYYEAAVRYYMYENAGDSAGAEKWLEKMKDAESRMGSFAAEKEKIDGQLQTK